MTHLTTKGFVLSSIPYQDANRMVRLLTPDLGLIVCSARGAARTKSQLQAATNPFVFASYQLFYQRDRYRIDSSELIDPFLPFMQDIERLTCAAHLAEVVLDLLSEQNKEPTTYRFWAYASHELAVTDDPLLTVHLAQLRLLADHGFAPWLGSCVNCRAAIDTSAAAFYFSRGGLCCGKSSCSAQTGPHTSADVMEVDPGTIAAINYVIQTPYERCFHFRVSPFVRERIVRFARMYLTYTMEKSYRKLALLETFGQFSWSDKHE